MTDKKPEAGCGAAILDSEGRLLLIQRLRQPEAGAWGLPGGKIDFGEPAAETARREIAEELGLEIEILRLACIAETINATMGATGSRRCMTPASCPARRRSWSRRSMAAGAGSHWTLCRPL